MRTLTIRDLTLPGSVVMAPMAGVGGAVFRQLAREHGACLTVTPLISAEALVRADPTSIALASPEEGGPCAVQIFGATPSVMVTAARIVERRGARFIDINAGCPSKRILAAGAGAALLRDPERLARIAAEVAQAVSVPVTLKTRLGLSPRAPLILPLVRLLRESGIAALTVHARFAIDSPSTPPRWEWIRAVVQETSLPVIGNGGIREPLDAGAMVSSTGCAGVMVGRAAVGRPWLLGQCQRVLDGLPPGPDPSLVARLDVARRHLMLQACHDPTGRELHLTAGVLAAYLRGFPHARQVRSALRGVRSYEELEGILRGVRDRIEGGGPATVPPGGEAPGPTA